MWTNFVLAPHSSEDIGEGGRVQGGKSLVLGRVILASCARIRLADSRRLPCGLSRAIKREDVPRVFYARLEKRLSGFYAHRVAGGYCHYCDSRGVAAASAGAGEAGGQKGPMHQQRKQLATTWMLYATDNADWLPSNGQNDVEPPNPALKPGCKGAWLTMRIKPTRRISWTPDMRCLPVTSKRSRCTCARPTRLTCRSTAYRSPGSAVTP